MNKRQRLGRKLRIARERAGLSQRALARELGVNQVTVHRWEARGLPFYLIDETFWQAARKLQSFLKKWEAA